MAFLKGKTGYILLGVAVLLQCALLAGFAARGLSAAWRTIGQEGLWRSAYFYQSQRFANFISYLNENAPQGARVVLPPGISGPRVLHTTPIMQFFLAPREVINCPDLDCLRQIDHANTYFIITDSEQAASVGADIERLIIFDEGWSVIIPDGASWGTSTKDWAPTPAFQNSADILSAALWPLLWIAILTVCGAVIVSSLTGSHPWLLTLTLGYGLGLTTYTLLLGALGAVGVPINLTTLSWMGISIVVAAIGLWLIKGRQALWKVKFQPPNEGWENWIWPVAIAAISLVALTIAVGKGYHSTDAILLWGAKGYGIASHGSLDAAAKWGTQTTKYPLHIPLLIASFREMFGEALPASKIVFSGYYLATLLICYYALCQLKVKPTAAGLATLIVGSATLVFRHGTIAYANLALSYSLLAAVMLTSAGLYSVGGSIRRDWYLLAGLFWCAAAWTRPEGLALAWLLAAALLITGHAWFRKPVRISDSLWIVIPLTLYSLFWWWFQGSIYGESAARGINPTNGIQQMFSGNLHLAESWYVLKTALGSVIDYGNWGFLAAGSLLALVATVIWRKGMSRRAGLWLICAGVTIICIMGIYLLLVYDTKHDISWWVKTGLDRMLMPGLLMLWIGGIGSVKLFHYRE